jgi:LysM repeat protein
MAAAPTLATVVAAFFLAQQAAPALAAQTAAPRPANLDAASQPSLTWAQLISATQQAKAARQATTAATSDLPTWYTVQPGDSLSTIAGRFYGNPAAWPVLYWRNHSKIHWANDIEVGQALRIPHEPAKIPAAPAQLEPAPPPPPPATHTTAVYKPRHSSSVHTPTFTPEQSSAPSHAAEQAPAPSSSTVSSGIPGGAFGQCVVARESGGNPQVMNASGHYGLYQFSASTWAEYGGNPADFGHASAAEQNQVFATALPRGGEFNWSPYDGC